MEYMTIPVDATTASDSNFKIVLILFAICALIVWKMWDEFEDDL